jgi:hypothetical protein
MTSIPHPEGSPQFKFGEGDGGVGTVTGVAKLDAYLVQYKDQEGKEQVRIAFRVPGADSTFLLNERVSGQNIATAAYSWFHKALTDKLDSDGLEKTKGETVESV